MVKLKDIADELNISANTISNALRDKGRISDEKRELIKRTAQRMGYIPNNAAKTLRSGMSKIIAIVYDNFVNPYYNIVTELLYIRLIKKGYSLIIFADFTKNERIESDTVKRVISSGAAALLSFVEIGFEEAELLKKSNISTVVIGRKSDCPNISNIISDDENGTYIAAKHLYERGKRNMLYINRDKKISCAASREAGFNRAVKEFGLKGDIIYYLREHKNLGQLIEISKLTSYDAVICFNDRIALELTNYCANYNINIPKQLSIVGFDNIQSHLILSARLTTIETGKEYLADKAVEALFKQFKAAKNNELFTENVICPTELVIGTTT